MGHKVQGICWLCINSQNIEQDESELLRQESEYDFLGIIEIWCNISEIQQLKDICLKEVEAIEEEVLNYIMLKVLTMLKETQNE